MLQYVHTFNFSDPKTVSPAESLSLVTTFRRCPTDASVSCRHELTLQSYAASAGLSLPADMLTPAKLRRLADELEAAEDHFVRETRTLK